MQYFYYRDQKEEPLNDMGMDLYNSLKFAKDGTYQKYVAIYPPLNYLVYLPIAKIVPDLPSEGAETYKGIKDVRTTQSSLMVFMYFTICEIFLLLCILLSISCSNYQICNNEKRKIVLALCIIFSGPVVYAAERGNNIFLVVFLLGAFFLWNHDKRKVFRELALVCLVGAAVLKLYPVFFGLILLKDKRWHDIFKCIIYGLAMFFIPFVFWGGIGEVPLYFETMFNFVGKSGSGLEFLRIDLDSILQTILNIFSMSTWEIANWKELFVKIVLIIVGAICCVSKSEWRSCLAVTLLSVLFSKYKFYYAAMLYWLPVCLFLREKEYRKRDYLYALAFVFVLAMFPYDIRTFFPTSLTHTAKPYSMNILITCIGEVFLLLLLFVDFFQTSILAFFKKKF